MNQIVSRYEENVSNITVSIPTSTISNRYENESNITASEPSTTISINIFHWVLKSEEITLATVYSCLSGFGLIGNIIVLKMLLTALLSTRNKVRSTSIQRSWLMLLLLSCVDTISLLCMIPNVINTINRSWLLGVVACKLELSFEQYSKLMSSYIIAALSADRYCIICHNGGTKSKRSVEALIIFMAVITAAVTILIMHYAEVRAVTDLFVWYDDPSDIKMKTIYLCEIQLPEVLKMYFPIALMSFGYISPGLLMAFFYANILYRTFKQGQRFRTIHVWKVTRSIILVGAVYYVFWSPYWIVTVLLTSLHYEIPPVIAFIIHALPFLTSAINPIVYSLLNRELWKAYRNTRIQRLRKDIRKRFWLRRMGLSRPKRLSVDETSFTPLVFEAMACPLNINLLLLNKQQSENSTGSTHGTSIPNTNSYHNQFSPYVFSRKRTSSAGLVVFHNNEEPPGRHSPFLTAKEDKLPTIASMEEQSYTQPGNERISMKHSTSSHSQTTTNESSGLLRVVGELQRSRSTHI